MTDPHLDELKMVWSEPAGSLGSDLASVNPLARAMRRLWVGGQPFKRLTMCYLFDHTSSPCWLGVLVESSGDRVLFFPGLREEYIGSDVLGFSRQAKPVGLDHVSLERNRREWHVTSFDSADHLGNMGTWPVGNGAVCWMGLGVARVEMFHPLQRETVVAAMIPKGDGPRRISVFEAATKGASIATVVLPPNDSIAMPHFLHFAFIVGRPDHPVYQGPHLGLLDTPASPPNGIVCRFPLSKDIDMQVVALRVPGETKAPITLSFPSDLGGGPGSAAGSTVPSI